MKTDPQKIIRALKREVASLQKENDKLKKNFGVNTIKPTVKVPKQLIPVFEKAEKLVGNYFSSLRFDPSKGTITINKERYVLVRASALSDEFLNTIKHLYKDRGAEEAMSIGKNILFDLAHVLGMEDANNFHNKMKLKDPVSKLSAGPVHFAHSGWAFVDILPESKPSPDENFYMKYHHPYSFEADSWMRAGKKTTTPVCIMNSGYSSGWCEASFGIALTAVEISCRAKGDKNCTFIMAPPHKIDSYLNLEKTKKKIEIPSFLERKKIEENLKTSVTEKEFLIKEIHHRIKNNLQIISSLLNLQADGIKDFMVKEKYTESISRIKSIAIIHELLYNSKNLSNLNIKDYLEELVSYISETYNIDQKINVTLDVHVTDPKKVIDLDKAIPCGIIINELMSNAFKYAFDNTRKGELKITFTEKEEMPHYKLTVADNGKGLPSTVDIKNTNTLGLQLVDSLVGQLNGTMIIDREKGTKFQIIFS